MSKNSESFHEKGFCIYRKLLDRDTVEGLLREADRLHALGFGHRSTINEPPVKWLVTGTPDAPILRGLQNGYRISNLLERVRTHPSVYTAIEPLVGQAITTIAQSLFWKPPGEHDTMIAYHQDAVFRKPRESFRNIDVSYIQCGIALDPHGPENGGMKFVLGSHRLGDLSIERTHSVMQESIEVFDLEAYGLSRSDEIDVELEPGDMVVWHPYLLHGSPPNDSRVIDRRFLVCGYMRTADCDTGVPAFEAGRPVH